MGTGTPDKTAPLQVLVLDGDDNSALGLLQELPGALSELELQVSRAANRQELWSMIDHQDPDVILAVLPGCDADLPNLMEEVLCQVPSATVVGLVREADLNSMQQAVRLGLQDLVVAGDSGMQHLARALMMSFERKRRLYYNEREVFRDPITGAMNRVAFLERLRYAILSARRRKERFCLASFEFQDFDLIAESFGWPACEALVRAIGGRFDEHLRATDAVARLRDNHFLVLLEGLSREKQPALAERLYAHLTAEPFRLELPLNGKAIALSLTARVGLSLYPEHVDNINLEEDVERLMFAADIALESSIPGDLNNVITFDPLLFEQEVIGGARPN